MVGTTADGSKFRMEGRCISGADSQFASYVHGTKGSALVSSDGHWPSRAAIYKGQKIEKDQQVWSCGKETENPYQLEWDRLILAIRNDTPHHEVERGAMSSLVTSMGRMAAHTGRKVTRDEILNGDHEFAPGIENFHMESEAPVKANAEGKYPVPQPGLERKRDYA